MDAFPHGLPAIIQAYGNITIRRSGRSWEVSTSGWEARNMTKAIIPGFPRVVYIHRALEAPLTRAMVKALASGSRGRDGQPYRVKTVSTFAPRPKRVVKAAEGVEVLAASSGLLSVHSWGLAVDINPDSNPLLDDRGPPPPVGPLRDLPDAWVEAFKSEGLTCGLYFPRPDSMHVQLPSGY